MPYYPPTVNDPQAFKFAMDVAGRWGRCCCFCYCVPLCFAAGAASFASGICAVACCCTPICVPYFDMPCLLAWLPLPVPLPLPLQDGRGARAGG